MRPDIDEALLDWLPGHMNKEAVVIVYFAGLATVSPNGEVFLVPYDGSIATSSRSYPLKDLEAALNRLKAKQTLFVFDGMVAKTWRRDGWPLKAGASPMEPFRQLDRSSHRDEWSGTGRRGRRPPAWPVHVLPVTCAEGRIRCEP